MNHQSSWQLRYRNTLANKEEITEDGPDGVENIQGVVKKLKRLRKDSAEDLEGTV